MSGRYVFDCTRHFYMPSGMPFDIYFVFFHLFLVVQNRIFIPNLFIMLAAVAEQD